MNTVSGQNLENKTDVELVELARRGDKDAFGVLARLHEATARRFAARLAGNQDLASEVLQEAMIEAYLSLGQLRDPARFKSWLCGIVLNVHRRHVRRRGPAVVPLDETGASGGLLETPVQPSPVSPQNDAERNELHEAVMRTLIKLAPAHREAILLFYFEDMSVLEIASRTGVSGGTVKVRLYRARRRLKDLFTADHPEMIPGVRRKRMIRVTIADVVKRERSDAGGGSPLGLDLRTQHVIVLKDEAGKRALPIWVGPYEGQSIATGMEKFSTARPMAYDFVCSLLKAVDATIEEVSVQDLKGDTFYAVVKAMAGGVVREIDARPSDALAVAVRTGSPIFVAENVMDKAGIRIPEGADEAAAHAGVRNIVKELSDNLQRSKSSPAHPYTKEQVARAVDELMSAVFKDKSGYWRLPGET